MITNNKAMEMAKKALEGKKLKAAGFSFLFVLIAFLLTAISNFPISDESLTQNIIIIFIGIINTIMISFFTIGFLSYFYKIGKKQSASSKDLFCGFKKFKRNLIICILYNLNFVIPLCAMGLIVALILPLSTISETSTVTIIFCAILYLCLCFFIYYKLFPTWFALNYRMGTNKSDSAIEILKNTYHSISKYNYQFFCLQIKFAGWFILCIITFGIAGFWVGPYYNTTTAILADAIINPDEYKNDILGEVPTTETVPAEPKRIEEEHHFSPEE